MQPKQIKSPDQLVFVIATVWSVLVLMLGLLCLVWVTEKMHLRESFTRQKHNASGWKIIQVHTAG